VLRLIAQGLQHSQEEFHHGHDIGWPRRRRAKAGGGAGPEQGAARMGRAQGQGRRTAGGRTTIGPEDQRMEPRCSHWR
jgi:hypothetical protein